MGYWHKSCNLILGGFALTIGLLNLYYSQSAESLAVGAFCIGAAVMFFWLALRK